MDANVTPQREHRSQFTPSRFALTAAERCRIVELVRRTPPEIKRDVRSLRGVVCDVVDRARAQSTPPEQLLAALKDFAKEANPCDDEDARALMALIVGWCIDRYYAAPPAVAPRAD